MIKPKLPGGAINNKGLFSPAVITSKAAQDHLNMIKQNHAEITDAIANQSQIVAERNAMRSQQEQAKRAELAQAQKEAAVMAQKQQELELKRLALNS